MDTTQVAAAAAETLNPPVPGTQRPAIGEYWPGQGGIYLGEAVGDENHPQGHLVLCEVATDRRFAWGAAIDWAAFQTADGHSDFRLPTRFEAALIYANGRKHVDTRPWYWTGTPEGASYAWLCHFYDGYQYYLHVSGAGAVRAVRRFAL